MSERKRAAFLNNTREFLSLWRIAHEWEGLNPEQTDRQNPPEAVKQRVYKLILGYFRDELQLRKHSGGRVPEEDIELLIFNLNRDRVRLRRCVFENEFNADFVDSIYVMRSDILSWCQKEFITPPACWNGGLEFCQ